MEDLSFPLTSTASNGKAQLSLPGFDMEMSNLQHTEDATHLDDYPGMQPPRQECTGLSKRGSDTIIEKIEAIFAAIVEDLRLNRPLNIPLRRRRRTHLLSKDGPAAENDRSSVGVKYPGASSDEAWQFAVVIRLLQLIHEASTKGTYCCYLTLLFARDVYYQDPALFLNQGVVDRYINDLAFTFGVQRSALNVTAAAKGLIAGMFTMTRSCGNVHDFEIGAEGALVPTIEPHDTFDLSKVSWILVIEKEAIFRTLAAERFYQNSRIGSGMIVTAKGYPDLSTRTFLHKLSILEDCPRIYGLMDYDPDGIEILCTYKFGSLAMAHENRFLVVPGVTWIGMKSSDVLERGKASDTGEAAGLLPLRPRDRRKAELMLGRLGSDDGGEDDLRRELQLMLMLNLKAEIEILCETSQGLSACLEHNLRAVM